MPTKDFACRRYELTEITFRHCPTPRKQVASSGLDKVIFLLEESAHRSIQGMQEPMTFFVPGYAAGTLKDLLRAMDCLARKVLQDVHAVRNEEEAAGKMYISGKFVINVI
ncbi:uncharacterized protein LOC129742632 [Uranotaenia lowii]|uniref:uncharacterized protein LOC129742632 n=1 Tax=Uranotaenia lowii TaxID=190385 RepID=UPI0024788272|nr:uncharacterized protein LOC129742632 [Uranotaenia lowii]